MEVLRTFDLLDRLKENYQKSDILSRRVNGKWIKYSIDDYIKNSNELAYGLLSLDLEAEDKIITICNNRPEWNFIDMACGLAGLVHVPVYMTLGEDDYLHIFNHSDAKVICIGNEAIYKKIHPIIEKMDRAPFIFLMDDSIDKKSLSDLRRLGCEHREKFAPIVEENKRETSPDKIATLIYTSGTTGTPKGVMLSHWNMMFNARGHAAKQTLTSENKMLSFLPLCHIYERSMNYEYQYLGISTYYAESLSTIASDMADCQADGFCAVPRVLEMLFNKLEAAGKDLHGAKRVIYSWAFHLGMDFDRDNHSWLYKKKLAFADKLIYSKWREKMGGREMLIVSGGSAIQAKIVKLFNAAKLHIYEGYGMTETSPVIAVNDPVGGINKIGTVGKKMEGTELSFAEDGEILTRGPHIMLGYYKDPEYTKEVIDKDGWLHTGDIGILVEDQYLKITDRKKEIFKLSVGKYIAPQVIENLLKESSYIENCIVIGENQKFASAIIIPNFHRLHFWAAKHKIGYANNDELIANPKVLQKIHKEIDAVNKRMALHEHIKRERVVNEDWTPLNNMLSQTLKLKRNRVLSKYSSIIGEIYK